MNGKSDDQKARESFASILSYYQQNQQSIENLPDWVQRPESSSISMGLAVGTVPSNEQTEELKADLKDLLSTQEAINKLSSSEKQLMIAAANSSKARRKDEN
jgi:Ribonuclease G/E